MSLIQMLLGAASDVIKDLYYNYVTLLLHGDGINAAQNNTFLDSSSNAFTVTRNGNTTQGTFSPYGSLWSNFFDGSGDLLTFPSSSAFDFSSAPNTIEFWMYPLALPGSNNNCRLYLAGANDNTNAFTIGFGSDGSIGFGVPKFGYTGLSAPAGTVQVNQWQHFAFVQNGASSAIYKNGVQVATGTVSSPTAGSISARIGYDTVGTVNFNYVGYISNFRIVKGTAVYTSAFTPSTIPLTAISGTSLLTCQSNRLIDNSSNNITITVNGNTSVQRFSPFATSSPYSASVNGGSMYFDGSGDSLQVPNNTAFTLNGDFTIEAWIYPTSSIANASIFSEHQNGIDFGFNPSSNLSYGQNFINWVLQSSSTVPLNAWSHVAISRQSNSVKLYINGTSVATGTDSSTYNSQTTNYIGYSGATYWPGYISNFRLVKGTAVYTSNFTPPTAPLTAITNTQLLLSGTNGGVFDNASSNDLETVSNAQVSTTQSKFGTASMYFDGASSINGTSAYSYISGTGDFTAEFWVYPSSLSSYNQILATTASGGFGVLINSNGTISYTQVGVAVLGTSTNSITSGTWSHVAVVRNNGVIKIFINGNQGYSGSDTTNFSAYPVKIGRDANASSPYTGYIDDLRITKGIARYLYNFTPPTKAFPDSGYSTYTPPTTDSYFGQTSLLLHGDGTNGAQNNTFLDSSPNAFTITRNGNATQGTFSPFSRSEGYWSNYFSNSNNSRLQASSASIVPATGNFTIELWAYPISTGASYYTYVSQAASSPSSGRFGLIIYSDGIIRIAFGDGVIITSPSGVTQWSQWQHVAVTRSGSNWTLYLNGVNIGTGTNSGTIETGGSFRIGTIWDGDGVGLVPYNGYISNLRITNTVVYSSNFTPSTAPLTAISGTLLLACQSNQFKDNSSNAYTFTTNGTPSVQTFIPFEPTTAYSTSLVGGSVYFDGSGDYLNTGTSGQFTASGDFTVSCWFYLQSFAASYYAVAGNWSAGTSDEWLIQIANDGSIRFLTSADGTFSSAGVVKLNQWMYFTATRSGTTVTVQVNGTTIRTYTKSDTLGSATKSINIGQQPGNNWPWSGYIADFRLVSGSAITTIPTAPSSSSGTSLLLSCTNAGIIDSAASIDFETLGTAQVSTTQSKFGGASMYFDGSSYAISSPNQSYALGTSDFTLEYWVYFNSTAVNQGGVCFGSGGSPYAQALFGWMNGSGGPWVIYLSSNNSSWDIANGVTIIPAALIATGNWYHVAITRYGSTFKTFCNGIQQSTFTSSASIYQPDNKVVLGRYSNPSNYYLSGYLEDVRFTKGISRYNYNFTIPASAYPDK